MLDAQSGGGGADEPPDPGGGGGANQASVLFCEAMVFPHQQEGGKAALAAAALSKFP